MKKSSRKGKTVSHYWTRTNKNGESYLVGKILEHSDRVTIIKNFDKKKAEDPDYVGVVYEEDPVQKSLIKTMEFTKSDPANDPENYVD